jgi:hypothetical protein
LCTCKITLPPGDNPIAVNKYYYDFGGKSAAVPLNPPSISNEFTWD